MQLEDYDVFASLTLRELSPHKQYRRWVLHQIPTLQAYITKYMKTKQCRVERMKTN